MYSVRGGLLAPPTALPQRDPISELNAADQYKKPTEEPTLQKLDLDKINQQWSNKRDKIISQSKMNKFSPTRFHPDDGVSTSRSKGKLVFSTETRTRPPIILPPKDPTIGLDLVKKCAKPKEEFKMVFLPEKIDFEKINEYYRNEDLKIINKNKPKEKVQIKSKRQNYSHLSPECNKGYRNYRKSFKCRRTSILKRKSVFQQTMMKNMKMKNDSLLDCSLIEKKIFNTKLHGVFKIKSPGVAQKKFPKPQIKLPEPLQKKKGIPKNVNKKPTPKLVRKPSASTKKISDEKPCTESSTSYLKEIENLVALNREDLRNVTKHFDAFKEAHEDRIVKITVLLKKVELLSSTCKDSEPPTARDDENLTLKKSVEQANTLRASTLKKTAQALNLYNSLREATFMMLSTPKTTRKYITFESPTPKDPKKIISRKIQQQCLMLQETPMRK